jgi:hypothetical protein
MWLSSQKILRYWDLFLKISRWSFKGLYASLFIDIRWLSCSEGIQSYEYDITNGKEGKETKEEVPKMQIQ